MKSKIGLALVIVVLLVVGLSATGCVSGLAPIGWSGGMVADDRLYIGSEEGRLLAVSLKADESRQWSEAIKASSSPGLFGCSPATGGSFGCGGGSAGVPIYGTPVAAGGLVYIAGYNGKIYAYNIETLAPRWVYPREDYLASFVGGLVEYDGRLFIGGSDGYVYALDAATGDRLWTFQTGDKIWATPAYYENTVYHGSTGQTVNQDKLFIGSFDKKLYALDPADGSREWEFTSEGAIFAAPLVFNSTVYIGSLDRNLYALRADDGELLWKITGENWFWAEPVVWDGNLYAGCLDGKVYVVKAETGTDTAPGTMIATIDLESPISSRPVIVDNSVIFATRKGVIFAVDTASYQARQLVDLDQDVDGPLTAYEGIIYVHAEDMTLQRVNAANGALLRPISLQVTE